jgi:hypothetical protein
MQEERVRYAAYDGRMEELYGIAPSEFIPLISDDWNNFFTWTGRGPIPKQEQEKLREIVKAAHREGRLLRFWGTPDAAGPERDAVWRELINAGVDLISTDDLKGLRDFLDRRKQ